jgi:CheY-like chemotaxis protein
MRVKVNPVDSTGMNPTAVGIISALIADDDPIALMMLEALLRSMSIKTHCADTVCGARAVIAGLVPSIAILDVQLPDGDGLDILLAMREANLETPVAFITASLEDFPFYKCGVVQPDKLFSKPLDDTAVRAWIEQMTLSPAKASDEDPGLTRAA